MKTQGVYQSSSRYHSNQSKNSSSRKMAFKVLLALAACVAYASASVGVAPVAYAAPLVKAVDSEYDPHPQYSYGYDVQDALTGDSKTHQETRDGDVVQGQYSLVEADGTRRIVDYTADPINGFNAVVRKEPLGGRLVAAAPVVAAPIQQAPIIAAGPAPIISEAPTVVDARLASPVARFAAPGPVAYSAGVSAPLAYSAGVAAPLAYSAGVAAPLAYSAGVASPLAYSARVGSPLAYSAGLASPLAYSNAIGGPLAYSNGVGAPLAYSNGIGAPLAYSAGVASPLAYSHGVGAPLAYSSPFARFSSPLPYSARFSPYTSVY